MQELLDIAINSLLFVVPFLHLIVAPYSKVEESFNLQATHDILVYGTPTSNIYDRLSSTYDHFTFPGAVPRTFLGSVILAGLSQPLIALVGFHHAQTIVRAVLGLFNASCLLLFRNAVAKAFGRGAARWWVLMLVSQFHVNYYATRLLPNMFSFGLTTLAAAYLLPHPHPHQALLRRKKAIGLLVFSAAIFRSETAILLFTNATPLLAFEQLPLRSLISVFLGAFVAALAISVPLDSFLWQKPIWPELWGFYFNAVLGSSSEWGVSPWYYYFASAVPRLLLNPVALPLIGLSLNLPATSRPAWRIVAPSSAFLAIYSLQPHKEARFVFYVLPAYTAAAALAANYITTRRAKSLLYQIGSLLLGLSLLVSFGASALMLLFSSLSYPGGDAVSQLYAITKNHTIDHKGSLSVHADVLTCMTGLTLFQQNSQGVPIALGAAPSPLLTFDKTEMDVRLGWPKFWVAFDYVLMEDPSLVLGDWEILGWVSAYDGIEILKPGRKSFYNDDDVEDADGELALSGAGHPAAGNTLLADVTICKNCKVVGKGAKVAALRRYVRRFTGGWWIGPKMAPRIYIMKRAELETHEQR